MEKIIKNGSEDLINWISRVNLDNSNKVDYRENKINIPDKDNVCLACPNSVWFLKNRTIFCHCRVMNTIEYSSKIDINMQYCSGKNIN